MVAVVSAGLCSIDGSDGATRPPGCDTAGTDGILGPGSDASSPLPNEEVTADLGSMGMSSGEFFTGTGGFSVCGAPGTGGNDVSIFRSLAFWPDSLRLLTEAASFVAVVGRGVNSSALVAWAICDSGTGGNAADGAGTGGGECDGAGFGVLDCNTSATVESDVPPVVLCEDTELL